MRTGRAQSSPLPKLGPYKQSGDRATRRRAYEAEGRWFDAHREELDALYDALVRNRTQQARNMGHETYLPLGYDRLGRNCYGIKEVEAFRDQIAKDLVPIVNLVRAAQARRLGLTSLALYDSTVSFPDGNAAPQGTAEEILEKGPCDVPRAQPGDRRVRRLPLGKRAAGRAQQGGKAPGGYCTEIPAYGAPFIFSNFNGTSDDVDVLTHEAGHAFAAYRAAYTELQPAVPYHLSMARYQLIQEHLPAAEHEIWSIADLPESSRAEYLILRGRLACKKEQYETAAEYLRQADALGPLPKLLERELCQSMELASRELQDYKTAYEYAARQLNAVTRYGSCQPLG